jgi:hypothetical protein
MAVGGLSGGRSYSALGLSSCLSRAEWGADEEKRFSDGDEVWPATFFVVQGLIVHHTVTANDDPDPVATIQAIYHQHAVLNGWGDIAYHYLIDETGRVYEGRWSGEVSEACGAGGDGSDFAHNDADELVTGGHTGYHNQGNVGIALLGNFASAGELSDPDWVQVDPKPAALDALTETLADLSMRHDIDPSGEWEYTNPMCDLPSDEWQWDCEDDGLPYFPGQTRYLISGHRDWRATACPGAAMYALLPDVRADAAARIADRPVITVNENPLVEEGNTVDGYEGPITGVSATHPNDLPITLTNNATDVLALGDNQVTWTATDPNGLYDRANQTVTVIDTTPPEITVPDQVAVSTSDPSGTTVTYVAAASDIVDPTPDLSCLPSPGSAFPLGDTTVTCDASDATANGSSTSFTVTVTLHPGTVGLVDPTSGQWHLRSAAGVATTFYYGNPGDVPFTGDWDCNGTDTPGLFRQSDAFAYLRDSNSQGIADIRFFFGNPSDIPLAGDFNGDGCDTLSIYRPSEARFYIINKLGENEGGLGAAEYSFLFGNPGDKPVVGDWDGDGVDEIGLHRETTGFFYYRNTLTTGIADGQFFFGDPGDRFVSGDWGVVDGVDTPAMFRPSNSTFYFRHTLTQGNADSEFVWTGAGMNWLPVSGDFALD